tara:strand:- start:1028 stop:1336 length:309 start_codon:yes stop_codon:yes gene_type:complete
MNDAMEAVAVAGEVAFGQGSESRARSVAKRIADAKRADEWGTVARLDNATITRTKTGVMLETRSGGSPSNPQPVRNFFPLAENRNYGTVEAMFLDFIESWRD